MMWVGVGGGCKRWSSVDEENAWMSDDLRIFGVTDRSRQKQSDTQSEQVESDQLQCNLTLLDRNEERFYK